MAELLKLRPVRPEDEPFLRELRAQVDAERLGLRSWGEEDHVLVRTLLDHQFNAHAGHHRRAQARRDTQDCIIELGGLAVGRFILAQDGKEVYLADIAVHHDHRGKGLGQAVIEGTKAECEQSKRKLRLHVELLNPALQFYGQLGFRIVERNPLFALMEWVPSSLQGKTRLFSPGGT
jgi:GNAT superfamily N-acetyltransferase